MASKRDHCAPSDLERLNYFNGQRLTADDYRDEQAYHMRVRRETNRALFTPGIASGLDIADWEPGDQSLSVTAGVALDGQGRVIVVSEDTPPLLVPGIPASVDKNIPSVLLTVRYSEERVRRADGTCDTDRHPSRVRATGCFEWVAILPQDDERIVIAEIWLDDACKIAHVGMAIRKYVNAAHRRSTRMFALEGEKDIDHYNPKVIVFHTDRATPDSVVLYLRGRQFSTLHYSELGQHDHGVRGATGFSGLDRVVPTAEEDFPTSAVSAAVGHHHEPQWPNFPSNTQKITLKGEAGGVVSTTWDAPTTVTFNPTADLWVYNPGPDANSITRLVATNEFGFPDHDHISFNPNFLEWAAEAIGEEIADSAGGGPNGAPVSDHALVTNNIMGPDSLSGDPHAHEVDFFSETPWDGALTIPTVHHTHQVDVDPAGLVVGRVRDVDVAPAVQARVTGNPLTYVDDLRIFIDNKEVTLALLDQAKSASTLWNATAQRFGDGTENHPLNVDAGLDGTRGTPPLQLHLLEDVSFEPGEHVIELIVPDNGSGGCIQYNLYVE